MRNELIHDILNELKKKKIIYLEAPCGWGKTVLLHQLEETIGRENCTFIHSSDIIKMNFMTDMNKVQKKNGEPKIFLVDNLGEWVVSGNIELLVNDIQNRSPECRYILAGRVPLPAQLLPYKLTSQIGIYEKNKLKYSDKELNDICPNSFQGNREQIRDLYEACHGMPLFLAVAEGFLEGEITDDKSTASQQML
ncbi:MAG: hypothetical protein ACI4SD_05005 [Suilimivivens sp.]